MQRSCRAIHRDAKGRRSALNSRAISEGRLTAFNAGSTARSIARELRLDDFADDVQQKLVRLLDSRSRVGAND